MALLPEFIAQSSLFNNVSSNIINITSPLYKIWSFATLASIPVVPLFGTAAIEASYAMERGQPRSSVIPTLYGLAYNLLLVYPYSTALKELLENDNNSSLVSNLWTTSVLVGPPAYLAIMQCLNRHTPDNSNSKRIKNIELLDIILGINNFCYTIFYSCSALGSSTKVDAITTEIQTNTLNTADSVPHSNILLSHSEQIEKKAATVYKPHGL